MAGRGVFTSRRCGIVFAVFLIVAVYIYYLRNENSDKSRPPNAGQSDKRSLQTCQRAYMDEKFSFQSSEINGAIKQEARSVLRNKECKKRLPNCLIIGVAKAGTYALLKFLSAHPSVVRNYSYNEVYFFDKKYENGLDWYTDKMPFSTLDEIVVEKTPTYYMRPEVPRRVHESIPNVRILLIVRDPVVRAVSAYAMDASRKNNYIKPFKEFVVMEPSGNVKSYSPFISDSTYDVHMERWLKYFDIEQLHVVDGDKLIKRPFEELGKVERFLGIKRYLTEDKFIFNETKHFYCLNRPDMDCLFESKGRKHPPVESNVVLKMKEFFKPHNDRFFKLIGKSFGWT